MAGRAAKAPNLTSPGDVDRAKYLRRAAKRRRRVRRKTISVARVSQRQLAFEELMRPAVEPVARPKSRSECRDGARPCPFVGCRYHLYLDVNPDNGSIRLAFPDLLPHEIEESCALDVAEREEAGLRELSLYMNLTAERVRQIEARAIAKIQTLREEGRL